MRKQEADRIYNIAKVENMIVDGTRISSQSPSSHLQSSKSHCSPDYEFEALVIATYDYTVKYRKLMNSNNRTAENEMLIFERLHGAIQDLYFFYEKNVGNSNADDALSIVFSYNRFFDSFEKFLDAKNAGRNFEEEVSKVNLCFDELVNMLLENLKRARNCEP